MDLIKGSTAAVAAAANIYCTTYFPLMTSERIWGITSALNQYLNREDGYPNEPAEYVFSPLNEPNNPTPAKKALIIGTDMPPTSSCKVQP